MWKRSRLETRSLRSRCRFRISRLVCPERIAREAVKMYSLASTHATLGIRNGEFVSALDPPQEYEDLTSQWHDVGLYPVLVGEEGDRSAMLASPESAGGLYDGMEIAEILTLPNPGADRGGEIAKASI